MIKLLDKMINTIRFYLNYSKFCLVAIIKTQDFRFFSLTGLFIIVMNC